MYYFARVKNSKNTSVGAILHVFKAITLKYSPISSFGDIVVQPLKCLSTLSKVKFGMAYIRTRPGRLFRDLRIYVTAHTAFDK